MAHVSVGLSQDLHVERLNDSIKARFSENVQVYLAHSNRIHHKVTKKMFAMKWGISKQKAKHNLEEKTQTCAGSNILPLSRRYWKD